MTEHSATPAGDHDSASSSDDEPNGPSGPKPRKRTRQPANTAAQDTVAAIAASVAATSGTAQNSIAAATAGLVSQNAGLSELIGKQFSGISAGITSPITDAINNAIGQNVFADLDWAKTIAPLSALRIEAAESILASIAPLSSGALDFGFTFPTSNLINSINSNTWLGRSISSQADFKAPPAQPSPYSDDFTSAADYFDEHDRTINSFSELSKAIIALIERNPDLPLVWRGARDARWPMHSSLFRHLACKNGVVDPAEHPTGTQNYPDEDQMVEAEKEILAIAREDWRLDGIPAFEVFAGVQHYGGPTRLIDVTTNPHIAAWFAIERSAETDDVDGRLFALATHPVLRAGDDTVTPSVMKLDEIDGGAIPSWHKLRDANDRQQHDWGTGAKRRLWIPPAYDRRITAQSAGFLLDGVPILTTKTFENFKRSAKHDHKSWTPSDLLASSSMLLKTASPSARAKPNRGDLAPTFSWRITPEGKRDIRRFLEERFGYRAATIYPDNAGLANYLGKNL